MPYMRVGSHLPIIVVLALVFVIPHDSSTRLNPDMVGADGYAMMPTLRRGLEQRDAFRKQQRPAKVLFRAARIAARKAAMGRVSWEVTMPPSGMVEPAGHTEHVSVPVFEAYEATGHTEHGPASAEKLPTAQRPQESQDPPPSTSALVLVPSEPGPHEQSRVPPLL